MTTVFIIEDQKDLQQLLKGTVAVDNTNMGVGVCFLSRVGSAEQRKQLEQMWPGIEFMTPEGNTVSNMDGYAGMLAVAKKEISDYRMQNEPAEGVLVKSPSATAKENYRITNREEEILEQLSKGFSYNEIANLLFISIKTLKKHIYNIYEKLDVDNKIKAVNKFYGLR